MPETVLPGLYSSLQAASYREDADLMSTCTYCGYDNIESARFCQSCGKGLSGDTPRESGAPSSTGAVHVGFWRRVLAALIDSAVLAAAIAVLSILPGLLLTLIPLSILVPWLYEALMLSSEHQATIGKMAIQAVVTGDTGGRISFAQATGRHFAKYLSGMILGIGFLMVAFTERKQGLHDLLARTVVVRGPRSGGL